jgi:hypothetical protein
MTTQQLEQEIAALQAQLATQHRNGDRVGKGSYHRNSSGVVAVGGDGYGIKDLGFSEDRIRLYDKVDGSWALPLMAHSAYRALEQKTFIYEGKQIKRYALEKPEGWIPPGMSEGETIAVVATTSDDEQTVLLKEVLGKLNLKPEDLIRSLMEAGTPNGHSVTDGREPSRTKRKRRRR